MKIKKETTDYEILESGSIIIPSSQYIEFSFDELRFRILFSTEDQRVETDNASRMVYEVQSDIVGQYLRITLFNFSASFFATSRNLVNVATLGGKQLFLKFSVLSVNQNGDDEDKIFFYTWFLEKNSKPVVRGEQSNPGTDGSGE